MTTFAKSTFAAGNYAAFRPVYNKSLFQEYIYPFHRQNGGNFDVAVDIGCGTGQVTQSLATNFNHVVGVDPSQVMLDNAVKLDKIDYRVGFAENLPKVEDHSIDLLTAGQAAHWFDVPKFVKEARRVLKPNGSIALFGYALPTFPESQKATQHLHKVAYDDNQLGPFWEPGRTIIQDRYKDIKLPFAVQKRVMLPEDQGPPFIQLDMNSQNLRNYLKTWSSYKNWIDKHKGEPDIIDKAVDDIVEILKAKDDDLIKIGWPSILILCKNDG